MRSPFWFFHYEIRRNKSSTIPVSCSLWHGISVQLNLMKLFVKSWLFALILVNVLTDFRFLLFLNSHDKTVYFYWRWNLNPILNNPVLLFCRTVLCVCHFRPRRIWTPQEVPACVLRVAKWQEFLFSLPGIVKQDPALPDDKPLPPPPPRPKNAIFEDEEKSKVKNKQTCGCENQGLGLSCTNVTNSINTNK